MVKNPPPLESVHYNFAHVFIITYLLYWKRLYAINDDTCIGTFSVQNPTLIFAPAQLGHCSRSIMQVLTKLQICAKMKVILIMRANFDGSKTTQTHIYR